MKSFSRLALCLLLPLALACAGGPEPNPMGSITTKQTAAGPVSAVVVSEKVPAPDYTFDYQLSPQVTAQGKVDSVKGALIVQPGMVAAQDYMIAMTAPGTIADIQTMYSLGAMMGLAKPVVMQIAGNDFLMQGVQLPAERTVIFRNLHQESHVAAYELLTLHFKAPE